MHPEPAQAKSAFLFLSEILGIYLKKKCLNVIVISGRETLMSVQVRCRSETNEVLRLLSTLLGAGLCTVHGGEGFHMHHYKLMTKLILMLVFLDRKSLDTSESET